MLRYSWRDHAQMMRIAFQLIRFSAACLLSTLGVSAYADIDTIVAAERDHRGNLARLVTALRQARVSDTGELANVYGRLNASEAGPRDVVRGLRSLLPDVTRLGFVRQRRSLASQLPALSGGRNESPSADLPAFTYFNYLDEKSAENDGARGWWLQGWGEEARQDDADGFDGFDARFSGVSAGLYYEISPLLTASISAGLFEGNVDSQAFGEDDQEGNDYSVSVAYTHGAHSVSVGASYEPMQIDRLRVIRINTGSGPRRIPLWSRFDTEQASLSLAYTHSFILGDSVLISSTAGLSYARLRTDDYTEVGGGSLSLSVQTEDEVQVVGGVGLDASWFAQVGAWSVLPSVGIAFDHDFRADPTRTSATFRGHSFRFGTEGYDVEQGRWRASIGLQIQHANGVGVGVSYIGHRRDDYRYDAVVISLQGRF